MEKDEGSTTQHNATQRARIKQHTPLNTVSTLRKYVPSGASTIAAVKPRSLRMTGLSASVSY